MLSENGWVNFWRVLLLVLILVVWQWGDVVNNWLVADFEKSWRKALTIQILEPFFISKPNMIWARFLELGCFTDSKGAWITSQEGGFAGCLAGNTNNLWAATVATLRNTFWGFLVGVGSGVVVGLILGRSDFLAKVFEPFIVAFNSLPRIALVPLIVLMFGLGDASKIMTAWVIVFFIVFFSTFEGARSVDRDHINVARLMGASDWQVTWTVVIPSTLAWVFAVLTPALSFSLIGVIIGEFIGAQIGLGKIIIEAEATLETADMMVALFVLMIVGVGLALMIRRLQAYLLRWQSQFSERA
ncbi:MAG: ABC transporter permease [Alphaproteobacteria bacterium]|nr:ABC transporter permease [Alphaproteobacteria bacterium]